MRNLFLSACLAASCLLPHLLLGGWVTERSSEFITSGDFDGDGAVDLAIIDKHSGAIRFAYQQGGAVQAMLKAYSGIDGVEGVTSGAILATNRATLAITGPLASRINLIDATNRLAAPVPQAIFPYLSVSMNQVVALDIGGTGNDPARDDLFTTTSFYTPAAPYTFSTVRNTASMFTNVAYNILTAEHAGANVFRMQPTSRDLAGFMRRGATDEFVAYIFLSEVPSNALTITGLVSGTHFVAQRFNTTGLAHIVTYRPGDTQIVFHAVSQIAPNTFTAVTEREENMGASIGAITPVAGTNQLVILNQQGDTSTVFTYTPGVGMTFLYNLATRASGGRAIIAVAPLGEGLAVLWGEDAEGRSEWLELFGHNGSRFVSLGDPVQLPRPGVTDGRANVWAFAGDPLTGSSDVLLAARSADWSTTFATSGIPSAITVTGEVDSGAASGLRLPTSRQLGAMPAGADYGLVNQIGASVSVTGMEPATGPLVGSVSVDPPAGVYPGAIEVTLTPSPSINIISYRVGLEGNWVGYATPFMVYADTTVYVQGLNANNELTPLQAIAYTFTSDPEDQDCDGDGVPDFVEIEYGANPCLSGADSDEDGLTDLEELLAGTNPALPDSDFDGWTDMEELRAGTDPNNPGSAPISQKDVDLGVYERAERAAVFDLNVTPRPYFQLSGAGFNGFARTGTQHRVYGLDGSLYGFRAARNVVVPGVTNPHAAFVDLPLGDAPGLVVYASDTAFPLTTTTNLLGREIIAIIAEPDVTLPDLSFTYGGGSPAAESINWIATAQSAWSGLSRPVVNTAAAAVEDTLVACLFELHIEQIMAWRGLYPDGVNLFPWRGPYGMAATPTAQELADLESASSGWPVYDLKTNATQLKDIIISSAQASTINLRQLVSAMYRASSTNTGPFTLPFDALRTFVRDGTLVPSYSNSLSINSSTLASAYNGVSNLLANLQPREMLFLELEARDALMPGDCVTLYDTVTGDPYILLRADGSPYDFTKTFDVISGTVFQVTAMAAPSSVDCPGDALEVVSLQLTAFVFATAGDTDGNLLPDEWELIALGGQGGSFTNDSDGDGFSDLQEYLDGTDPADPGSSSSSVADLSSPGVALEISGTNVIVIWDWPAEYADRFNFTLQTTESLGTNFVDDVTVSGELSVSSALGTSVTSAFHRVGISLRE